MAPSMKSVGLVGPFLAAGVAARALDPRAELGVLPDGSVCPAPLRLDTLIVQPAEYTEFFPYNTVIDPFRNMDPFTVSGAPTTVILSTELPVTTIIGGTETVVPSTTASTTSSSAGTEDTGSATQTTSSTSAGITQGPTLSVGAGLPAGAATDVEDFVVLAYTSIFIQPAKREVKREEKRQIIDGSQAMVVVDLVQDGDVDNALAVQPPNCDQGTPLLLKNGMLINGNRAIAKAGGASQAVMGFLTEPTPNPVNATMVVENGLLSWLSADGMGPAAWYSCPDGLWAGFPVLSQDRLAGCTRVRAALIAGAECTALVRSLGREPNPNFVRPADFINPPASTTSSISTATETASTSTGTDSSSTMTMSTTTATFSTMSGFQNTTTTSASETDESSTTISLPSISLPSVSLPSISLPTISLPTVSSSSEEPSSSESESSTSSSAESSITSASSSSESPESSSSSSSSSSAPAGP